MLGLLVPGVGMGGSGGAEPESPGTVADGKGKFLLIGVGCLAGLLLLVGCR